MRGEGKRVLFICTGNSARSQMAEGIMNHLSHGEWKVQSAGIFPSYVHPLAIRVMGEIGIDISQQTSKSIDQFAKKKFDYVITLCDDAAKSCPIFPGLSTRLHWPFQDPAAAIGTFEERVMVFRKVRDEIKTKIEEFLKSESFDIPDAIASFKF